MDDKDIAVAVIGAGLALAAVVVVFMGFLTAHVEALPDQTPLGGDSSEPPP
jgi:hypothetical protein